jgi:hypothetical protein
MVVAGAGMVAVVAGMVAEVLREEGLVDGAVVGGEEVRSEKLEVRSEIGGFGEGWAWARRSRGPVEGRVGERGWF